MLKVKLDEGARAPERAHNTDAGYDIFSRETKVVPAHGSEVFDTGVHIEMPIVSVGFGCEFYGRAFLPVGFLKSKSGLNVKHGLTSEGVIDYGYTGSICVKLYNNSDTDYLVHAGDKISQLVIMPILTPQVEIVSELEETDRGDNGFGSTGK